MGGRLVVPMDPNPHFLGSCVRKTKPNRWVERPPKIRDLPRCHCLLRFYEYEKTTKTYQLGSNIPLPPPASVVTGLREKPRLIRCKCQKLIKINDILYYIYLLIAYQLDQGSKHNL